MPHAPASSALARFRVLDLTRVRAGPTCVKQLADFGTDVIKFELPPLVEVETMSGPRHGFEMRLGIDYSALHQMNRRIVFASISGFGQDGPYGGRPGFDQIAQAKPELGEHTVENLAELGYTTQDLAGPRERRVI
jgi:crotonobetainyl-CoA:carnitine CoA-transferase CaiB-like acyl-CoA transferase